MWNPAPILFRWFLGNYDYPNGHFFLKVFVDDDFCLLVPPQFIYSHKNGSEGVLTCLPLLVEYKLEKSIDTIMATTSPYHTVQQE